MGEPATSYWQKAFIWTVMALVSYIFWRWLVWYLLPFAIAIILAFLLSPLVGRIKSYGINGALAAILALACAIFGFLALCAAVISLLAAELVQISHRLPHYLKARPFAVGRYLQQWNRWRTALGLGSGHVSQELASVYQLMGRLVRELAHALVQLPEMALILIVSALAAFFMLRDANMVRRATDHLAPPRWRGRIGPLSTAMARGLFGYLQAEFALVALTGLATMGGLLLITAPYAVLIGLTAGLLDMVPFMGPTVLLVPWAIGALVTGNVSLCVRLLAVLVAVAIIRQIAEPRLVGRGTGLHPLVVLFSLYMGVRLFGAGGVLVGPVTAVMFKAIGQVMAHPAVHPPKTE